MLRESGSLNLAVYDTTLFSQALLTLQENEGSQAGKKDQGLELTTKKGIGRPVPYCTTRHVVGRYRETGMIWWFWSDRDLTVKNLER